MDQRKKLDIAIQKCDLNTIRSLIGSGVSLGTPFADGILPLERAVIVGDFEVVLAVLGGGADINAQSNTPNGDTALTTASARGRENIVQLLLDRGANVNLTNKLGLTPLLITAGRESVAHLNILKKLIQANADLNLGRYVTPLMIASRASIETVRILVAAGADVNAVKPSGTALLAAIDEGEPKIVQFLLEHDAEISARTPTDWEDPNLTAKEFARVKGNRAIVQLLTKHTSLTDTRPIPDSASSLTVTWGDLRSGLDRAVVTSLRKGASASAITKLEQVVGLTLPDSFKIFYQSNDGQKPDSVPLVPPPDNLDDTGYTLLPINVIISDWKMLRGLLEKGEFDQLKGVSDQKVRPDWWNIGWIPFAGNGHGDYLCLDMVPRRPGKKGQIISVNHESPRRTWEAGDFLEWLSQLFEAPLSARRATLRFRREE